MENNINDRTETIQTLLETTLNDCEERGIVIDSIVLSKGDYFELEEHVKETINILNCIEIKEYRGIPIKKHDGEESFLVEKINTVIKNGFEIRIRGHYHLRNYKIEKQFLTIKKPTSPAKGPFS